MAYAEMDIPSADLHCRDNVQWSQQVFENKVSEVSKLVHNATYIPCNGLKGDNFVDLSPKSAWYAKKFENSGSSIPQPGTLLSAIDILGDGLNANERQS